MYTNAYCIRTCMAHKTCINNKYVNVYIFMLLVGLRSCFLVSVLYWRWPPQKGHHYYHHITHIAHVAFVCSVEVLCAYIPTQLTFYISVLSYILLWGIIIIYETLFQLGFRRNKTNIIINNISNPFYPLRNVQI